MRWGASNKITVIVHPMRDGTNDGLFVSATLPPAASPLWWPGARAR